MANTAARRGLINPRLITGGSPHMETRPVAAAFATALYPGQPVCQLADGTVRNARAAAGAGGISCLGVCMSYLPAPSTAAASQVNEVQVVTDLVNTVWEFQLSTALTGTTIVGMNVSCKNIASVSAATKQSRMNGGTPITTTGMPFRIVGFATDPKNEKNLANSRVLVRLNNTSVAGFYNTPAGL